MNSVSTLTAAIPPRLPKAPPMPRAGQPVRLLTKALLLAVAAAAAVTGLHAHAASPAPTSWDLSSEFTSTTSSPVWSYGSKVGSTFNAFTSWSATSIPCLTGWTTGLPVIGQNTSPTNCTTGTVTLAPRAMLLHPGASGDAAIVRFKAPYSAQYRVSGQFYGIDANGGGTHTNVSIVANYAPNITPTVYSGAIALTSPSTPSVASFTSVLVMLQAGQTLDFTVKAGPGNNFWFGSTGLNAVIERAAPWCGPTNPADPATSTC